MSSNKEHQRIYDKKNYCLYCEKPFAKLTRHLKQKHADNVEVAKALAHSQGSTMHRLLLEKIWNMGNYHHNCSVLSSGNGLIIPKRQATYPSTATDYLPCKFCFAMYCFRTWHMTLLHKWWNLITWFFPWEKECSSKIEKFDVIGQTSGTRWGNLPDLFCRLEKLTKTLYFCRTWSTQESSTQYLRL